MRRVRKHLTTAKAKLLYNAFILHASVFWMFSHKRDYLNIVYNSNESYDVLLLPKNEVSIYQKQLRILDTEVFLKLSGYKSRFYEIIFCNKRNTLLLRRLKFFENAISTLYKFCSKFNFISSLFSME